MGQATTDHQPGAVTFNQPAIADYYYDNLFTGGRAPAAEWICKWRAHAIVCWWRHLFMATVQHMQSLAIYHIYISMEQ